MTTDAISKKILYLKQKILSWSDSNREGKNPETFEIIEKELKQLLSTMTKLNPENRAKIDPILNDFKADIVEHYHHIQQELKQLKQNIDQNKKHKYGINNYNAFE